MNNLSEFKFFPSRPTSNLCDPAFSILCSTHSASSSFLSIFTITRRNRNARGTPRDVEQDLLRAAFSFASSGLDSLVKQLVRDALPYVVENDDGANENFRTFIERKLRDENSVDHKFLATILVSKYPRKELQEFLINELISNSLQSKDALFKVGSYFNIPSDNLFKNPTQLQNTFLARNQIIHEMDIDFTQPNRSRRPRTKADIFTMTNIIFEVSNNFLREVDIRCNN